MPRCDIPWDKIRDEYIFDTTTSLRRLALKHGLSAKSVERRCKYEGWVEERRKESAVMGCEARTRIREAAVEDKVKVYDVVRSTVEKLVAAVDKASSDSDLLFRHLVSSEERTLNVVNGRNFAEVAKGLRDLVDVARRIDGIIDPAIQAKLELERERLEIDRKKAGQSDDVENECGIAYMPVVDLSLLDDALPDPDDN